MVSSKQAAHGANPEILLRHCPLPTVSAKGAGIPSTPRIGTKPRAQTINAETSLPLASQSALPSARISFGVASMMARVTSITR